LKIKEDVEKLQQKYINDYEKLATITCNDFTKTAEAFTSENSKQREKNCCGKNATDDSFKCCSEGRKSEQKPDCSGNSATSCNETMTAFQNRNDVCSANVKEKTRSLLLLLRKNVETIERQLTTFIEKNICPQ